MISTKTDGRRITTVNMAGKQVITKTRLNDGGVPLKVSKLQK